MNRENGRIWEKRLITYILCVMIGLIASSIGTTEALGAESKALSTYRALAIGCGKYTTGVQLSPSPENDAAAFGEAFRSDRRFNAADIYVYQNIKSKSNKLSNDRLMGNKTFSVEELILQAFKDATVDDVSYFFMSGHGSITNGVTKVIFSDNQAISYDDLKVIFDKIKGTKVVIVDACYSGGAISKVGEQTVETLYDKLSKRQDEISAQTAQDINRVFGSSSKVAKSSGAMTQSEYKVLTASSLYELSWGESGKDSSYPMGLFTRSMLLGCGWVKRGSALDHTYADTDGDGDVTLLEMFNFTRSDNWFTQAQVYPQSDNDFALYIYPRAEIKRSPLFVNPVVTHVKPYKLTLELPQKSNLTVSVYSYALEGTRNGGVYFRSNNVETLYTGAVNKGKTSFTYQPSWSFSSDLRYVFAIQEKGSSVSVCVPFATEQGKPSGGTEIDGEFYVDGIQELPINVYFSSNCAIEVAVYSGNTRVRLLVPTQVAIPIKVSEYATMDYTRFWWDGYDDNGMLVEEGTYKIQVKLVGNSGSTYYTNSVRVIR